jgi:hypothetical protein
MALVWAGLLLDQPTYAAPLRNAATDSSGFSNVTASVAPGLRASYLCPFRGHQLHRASHDAGTHGNPAVAPSPVTQGWTETTGAGTSVGGDPLQVHDV